MNQLLTAPKLAAHEVPVRLEQLEPRLKAIVRLKLREFIHLTPVFQDIPSTELREESDRIVGAPMRINGEFFFDLASVAVPAAFDDECPNRPIRIAVRRRVSRAVGV